MYRGYGVRGKQIRGHKMTVAELIEQLEQFPSEATVFFDGYEGGLTLLEAGRLSLWTEPTATGRGDTFPMFVIACPM